MNDTLCQTLRERMLRAVNNDGSWGYVPGQSGAAEPTALAALAISEANRGLARKSLAWLASIQTPTGGVPIRAAFETPCWPTPHCVLAWHAAHAEPDARRRGANWLLKAHGESITDRASMYDHDQTLIGWSWVAGTHSWVDPTAHAVLALRAAGLSDHPRTREGVKLLLDRAMPDGGWNFGNRTVLGAKLRPFPANTGMALAALNEQPDDPRVRRSAAYLTEALTTTRAPMSLAWGLIGLTAISARPAQATEWLAEACARADEFGPLEWALLHLATDPSPLLDLVSVRAEATS